MSGNLNFALTLLWTTRPRGSSILRGNLREILRKGSKNNNKAWILAFWSHFRHFGRLLGKICLFLTPSKTGGRVPSQQGAPTTSNRTYWEVSRQTYVQTLLASLGVVIGRNSALQWGGEGGGSFWRIADTIAILDTKSPQTPWIVYYPATISPSFQGHIIFSKSSSQQRYGWRTDILRNISIGCPCILCEERRIDKRQNSFCTSRGGWGHLWEVWVEGCAIRRPGIYPIFNLYFTLYKAFTQGCVNGRTKLLINNH